MFGTNGGDAGAGAYTAERQILVEILRTTNEPDVVALVRDRLAVIAEGGASHPERQRRRHDRTTRGRFRGQIRFSSAWTLKALRDIAKGTRPVPSALATGAFWEDLVAAGRELAHLRATGGSRDDSLVGDDVADTAAAPTREPLWRGLDVEARRIREKLRRDGYAQCPRPEAFEDDPSRLARDPWTDALGGDTTLDDLADAMDALRVAGWPPSPCTPSTPPGPSSIDSSSSPRKRLGDRGVALEPSCFAWALRPAPAESQVRIPSAEPRDAASAADAVGANFLFRTETIPRGTRGRRRPTIDAFAETTENRPSCASGFPLTDATLDTGCLHVLPRHVDRTWDDPDHPDHLRPAERESREEAPRYDSPRGEPSASGGGGIGLRVGGPDRALGRIVSPPRGRRHLRG